MSRELLPIEITPSFRVTADQVTFEYSRGSGPGGQHVNKTETRVTLRLPIDALGLSEETLARVKARLATRLTQSGELLLSAESERSRQANIHEVWTRLGDVLRAAYARPKSRKKTRPTLGSKRRRLEDKKRTSDRKRDRKNTE